MNKKLIHRFFGKSAATLIAIALILTGVCFFEGNVNIVSAADSETEGATLTDDGYYVMQYTADEFAGYRVQDEDGNYAYPKFSDPDWLFAGWFTDEACTTAVGNGVTTVSSDVYAKFVEAGLSYVKCQITPDTDIKSEKTNMRIISAMESNLYSGAGFYVTYKGSTRTCKVSTLYARLSATDDNMECGYSPVAFHEDGKYFSAVRLTNIGNANFDEPFYIQSYWKTLDGTTVSGMSRYVRVEDSYNQIVNVSVRMYSDAEVTGGSVTVSYSTEQFSLYKTDEYTTGYDAGTLFDTVTIDTSTDDQIVITGSLSDGADAVTADGILVNLRLQLKADAGLKSNTTFAVSGESFTNGDSNVTLDVSDVVFKNYPLAYGGTPDKSWYEEFCDEDEETYVISSAADLYGLAEIVNSSTDYASEQFVNDKIILGADVTINDVTAQTKEEWETLLNSSVPEYSWTPIGTKAYPFKGTFDGDGHSISGIYFCDDSNEGEEYSGLFGEVYGVDLDATLENFSIKNSYFESKTGWSTGGIEYAMLGSVAGRLRSVEVYSVSSEAVVVSEGRDVGGFAGRAQEGVTIDDCWFGGEVYVEQETETKDWFVGGFVGNAFGAYELNVKDCLNTGTVKLNYTTASTSTLYLFMGGFIGGNGGNQGTMNLTRCVHAGYVTAQNNGSDVKHHGVSVFVGAVNKDTSTANVTDSYVTEGSYLGYHCQSVNSGKVVASQLIEKSKTELTAHLGYVNAENLVFYDAHATSDTNGKWVATETGIPMLESFTDHWIDVMWYYEDSDADAFEIKTVEELYGLSVIVNNTDENFSGHNIVLGADIKVNSGNAALWASGTVTPERAFTPIGDKYDVFSGNFNGQGHTISGIYINESSNQGVGLFGYVNASISNLRLENSCVKSGMAYTGSIAGLSNAPVSNVYSDAYVMSSADNTGGILGGYTGKTDVSVSNSWYDGQLSTSAQGAGGIVGYVYMGTKLLEDCLFTGTIESSCPENSVNNQLAYVGGMIGYITKNNDAPGVTIDNCVSAGTIESLYNIHCIASLVGRSQNNLTIKNAYTTIADTWTAIRNFPGVGHNSVNGNGTFTGMVSNLDEDEIVGLDAYKYTELDFYSVTNTDGKWAVIDGEQLVLKELYTGNGKMIDDFSSVQQISTGWYHNNVVYTSYNSNNVAIEQNTNYTVGDEADFYGFARIVNNGYNFNSKTVTLTADVDLNSDWTASSVEPENTWTPIGNSDTVYFDGTFNGGMKTIKGVYVNATTANAGLFGYVGLNGTVQSLRLENSYMTSSAGTLGSVVGLLQGNVEEVYSAADVVSTGACTGGVVGDFNRGTDITNEVVVSNCWFDGTVKNSDAYCGGVIGRLYKGKIDVNNVLNTGTVTSTYNTSYWGWAGGLIGGIESQDRASALYVNLSDSVSAGEVYVMCGTGGSVYGRSQRATVTIQNVYTTDQIKALEGSTNTWDVSLGITGTGRYSASNCTVKGVPVAMTTKLQGDDAYVYTELAFYTQDNTDGLWTAVEDNSPVLRSFRDVKAAEYDDVQRKATGWYYNSYTWKYDSSAGTLSHSETSYTVSKADDLWGLAELVNNEKNSFTGMTITLANSITLNDGDATEWAKGENCPVNSWIPIGTGENTSAYTFSGTFDGNEQTISGVYMKTSANGVGLFGNVQGATIQDLRVVNSCFVASGDSDEQYAIGSIVGWCGSNNTSYNTNTNNILNVYSDAIVVAKTYQVGGIVGRIQSPTNIEGSWFDGKIQSTYNGTNPLYTGGIVGVVFAGKTITTSNDGYTVIDGCLNSGEITFDSTYTGTSTTYNAYVGGILGYSRNDGAVTKVYNSLSTGKVYGTLNEESTSDATALGYIGAIYGFSDGGISTDTCYSASYITRAIGTNNTSSTVTTRFNGNTYDKLDITSIHSELNMLQAYGSRMFTDLPFVESDRVDGGTALWMARIGDLPIPSAFGDLVDNELASVVSAPTEWDTDTTTVYELDSIEDLYGFAILSQTFDFDGCTVQLSADIAVNDNEGILTTNEITAWEASGCLEDNAVVLFPWQVIATAKQFAGVFDGLGYEVSGIYASDDDVTYMGFFGRTLESDITTLDDGTVISSGVDTASVIKNFRLVNSYFNNANSAGYVGSIVADLRGMVDNVYSNAIIENAGVQAGGIIGRLNGVSYESTSTTSDTTVEVTYGRRRVAVNDCWFDGKIYSTTGTGGANVGGVAGILIQGAADMTNCLFTGTITSNMENDVTANIGGLCGASGGQAITSSSTDADTGITTTKSYYYLTLDGTTVNYEAAYNKLYISDSISAGKLDCEVTDNSRIGGVLGRLASNAYLTSADVFTSYAVAYTGAGSHSGVEIRNLGNDRLMGYIPQVSGTTSYSLDFESDEGWTLRTDGVPVPAAFEDVVVDKILTDTSQCVTELGLDYWNTSETVANAIPYGSGNYQLSYVATDSLTYEGYLAKLNELGYTLKVDNTSTSMSSDGVYSATYYNASTGWVIQVSCVKTGTTETRIYISFNSDVDSIAATLLSDNDLIDTTGTEDVSLSMLELVNESAYGNGFVFRLSNGHFIVNDGGQAPEAKVLVAYLKSLAGTTDGEQNPVYIDAWIITHYHVDHSGALAEFYNDATLREGIYLNAVYASEPSVEAATANGESNYGTMHAAMRGAMTLTKSATDLSAPDVYQLHIGQRYYFTGITMDVIDTQEQHHYSTWDDYNDPDLFNATSTNCVYTMTDTGKKVLLGGDSTNVNMRYMMTAYGKNYTEYSHENETYGGTSETLSNINIFAAYHHGKNTTADYASGTVYDGIIPYDISGTATYEWADYLLKNKNNPDGFMFDTVLFPYHQVFECEAKATWEGSDGTTRYSVYVGDDDSIAFPYNMSEINEYLIDNAAAYYTCGYEDLINGTKTTADTRHGTVQLTFGSDGSITTTVYKELYSSCNTSGTTPDYTIEVLWKKEEE